jgi:aldehyde dehydrogenase
MVHQAPDQLNATFPMRRHYDNFIGGKLVAPIRGRYFVNPTPMAGGKLYEIARL